MKKLINYLLLFIILSIPFSVDAKDKDITLYLFHGDGCPHCAEEIEYIPSLEKKYPNLKIKKYEVWYNEENSALLEKVNSAFDITRPGVPTNIIGATVISGFGTGTNLRIENAIDYYMKEEYVDIVSKIIDDSFDKEELNNLRDKYLDYESESDEELSVDTPVIGKINLKNVSLMTSAVLIGLIDGFNPCAMWILLFLISVLLGMKNRRRMWALGLTFLVTSALVYMLIMLSWISVAVKITSIIWVRNIIAVIAIIGAIINLKSFINSKDSGCDVVDEKKRKNVFKKIRKFTSEKSFILALLGVIGLAISVNLIELACSAGLPLVFSELLVVNNVSDFMKLVYTLIYILFFLLDDMIIFFIAMFTMKITGISTKYNKYSHLLGGLIMLLIGILLLIKPEWLMFNFK